jgi:ribosomal-protein-alanine N-acetyltransferase
MPFSNDDSADPPPLEGATLGHLEERDIDQVIAIERVSFRNPWRAEHFRHEIHENPRAVNRVVRRGSEVLAYSCVWQIHDELKINNIAVRVEQRGCGLGRWLLRRILADARRGGCVVALLEVRASNQEALGLYRAHGFVEVGRRKGYYQQEGEDAILMELSL